MQTLLIVIAVIYAVIGLVVYATTDTQRFAHKVPFLTMFVKPSEVSQYLFVFVVVAWPLWLAAMAMGPKRPE